MRDLENGVSELTGRVTRAEKRSSSTEEAINQLRASKANTSDLVALLQVRANFKSQTKLRLLISGKRISTC